VPLNTQVTYRKYINPAFSCQEDSSLRNISGFTAGTRISKKEKSGFLMAKSRKKEWLFIDTLKYTRVEEKDEHLAWELAKKYTDKDFSFTDCLSFTVMSRLDCRKVFAFDQHFRQMGFEVFP